MNKNSKSPRRVIVRVVVAGVLVATPAVALAATASAETLPGTVPVYSDSYAHNHYRDGQRGGDEDHSGMGFANPSGPDTWNPPAPAPAPPAAGPLSFLPTGSA